MYASHMDGLGVTRRNGSNCSSRQTVSEITLSILAVTFGGTISYSGTIFVVSILMQFFAGNRVDGKRDSRIGIFSHILKREA